MPDSATDFSALPHFLCMDTLPPEDVALLLVGLDPRSTHFPSPYYDRGDGALGWLDGRERLTGLYADNRELTEHRRQYLDVIAQWQNTVHPANAFKGGKPLLQYSLAWAERMGIKISWQQWAVEQELWPAEPKPPTAKTDLSDRERESLLNIIHALKKQCLALGGANKTQDWLIVELTEKYINRRGVSTTKLKEVFAEANKLNH